MAPIRWLRLRRLLCGPWIQLIVKTLMMGIGLYAADTISDIVLALKFIHVGSEYGQIYQITGMLLLLGVILPGLIASMEFLSSGAMSSGIGHSLRLRNWRVKLLAPIYIVLFPCWWGFVPILR